MIYIIKVLKIRYIYIYNSITTGNKEPISWLIYISQNIMYYIYIYMYVPPTVPETQKIINKKK